MSGLAGRKVLFVFDVLELGGAERQGLLLARHLQREAGARVEVWGFRVPGRVTRLCEEAGIPWRLHAVPWPSGDAGKLGALARLAWALRRARPDAILAHLIRPNIRVGAVWRLTGASAFIWNQGDAGTEREARRLERWVVPRVPCFVSNSTPGVDFLVNTLGVPRARVELIRNGIEPGPAAADRASWRARLGLEATDFVACMVANIHPLKDHVTLLRAWRLVVDREGDLGRRAVLLLAGHPYVPLDPLTGLVSELGLTGRVQFLGQVTDIPGLHQAVDLSVLSSRAEGSPNALLEGMAAGLAVAATDNPGIRETVGVEGAPFLAAPGDAVALGERIVRLAGDPGLRARLGAAYRRRVAAEFSVQRMCERMTAAIVRQLGPARGQLSPR